MGYVKASKDGIAKAKETATSLQELITAAQSEASGFSSTASSESSGWVEAWWDKHYTEPSKGPYQDKDGNWTDESGWISACNAAKENAKAFVRGKIGEFTGKAGDVVTKTKTGMEPCQEVIDKLQELVQAIETFEATGVSLEEALQKIENGELDGYSVETREFDGEKVEVVVYTDKDGNKYTIAEMINAYYTYVGTVGNGAVALASSMSNSDAATIEAALAGHVKNATEGVNSMLSRGFMSVASQAGIQAMFEAAVNADSWVGDKPSYDNLSSSFEDAMKKLLGGDKYQAALDALTGADTSKIAGVLGLALGAYTLTNWPKVEEGKLPDDDGAKDADDPDKKDDGDKDDGGKDGGGKDGGGQDGGGRDGGGRDGGGQDGGGRDGGGQDGGGDGQHDDDDDQDDQDDDDDDQDDDDDGRDEGTPELEKVDETPLPEEVKVELAEKNYDDLAREQYETTHTQAEIDKHRAEVTEEANRLFDMEDKTELKEKLKEYGYSEIDIEEIIKSRDLTVAALVQGDYRAELAKIAKDLASADGVTDFDSTYDNGLSCKEFYDGTNEAYLANMSSDSTVSAAKTAVGEAQKAYEEAVQAANESITKAKEAKTNLETVETEIKESMASDTKNWSKSQQTKFAKELKTAQDEFIKKNGDATKWDSTKVNEYQKLETDLREKYAKDIKDDPDKWSKENVEKYNEAVKSYNESVKAADESNKAAQEAKESYDKSQEDYTKAKEDFMERIKNENKHDSYLDHQHDADDPGTQDPGTQDPGTQDPGTQDPGTQDPGTQDPGTQDPGTQDPGTEDPLRHHTYTVPDDAIDSAVTIADDGTAIVGSEPVTTIAYDEYGNPIGSTVSDVQVQGAGNPDGSGTATIDETDDVNVVEYI